MTRRPVHAKAEASGNRGRGHETPRARRAAKALADILMAHLETLPMMELERRLRNAEKAIAEIIERKRGH